MNQPKSILCLGGGGYSIPKDMIKRYPKCRVDVVELVPEITWIAERYFYAKHKRIRSFNQDAREFLEKNKNLKYDLIYIDISLGGKFCYSLATREAARALLSHLKKDGVLVSNAGKAIGKNLFKAVKAIYKTYGTVFTQVFAFSSERTERKKGKRRKITLLASKSSRKYLFVDLKKLAGKDKLKSKLINTRVKINTRDIPVLKDGSFHKHDRKLAYRLYPPEIFKKEVNEDSGRGWTL